MKNAIIELQDLNKQISDAHGDVAETERTRRQNEAVEKLKRAFQDRVLGRLIDLCQPSHKKYQVAITKVSFYLEKILIFLDFGKIHDWYCLRHG